MQRRLSDYDHQYMDSLGEALAEHTPKKIRYSIYFWLIAVIGFIYWASVAEVNEVTRGHGEVVPSGNNKVVQNLEGGIVKNIFVQVGDTVKKGAPLLEIENEKAKAQMKMTEIKIEELTAKRDRLRAEAYGTEFKNDKNVSDSSFNFYKNELNLYKSHIKELNAKLDVFKSQKKQKEYAKLETKQKITDLKKTARLMAKEIAIMKPMVRQGVKSKVELMHLQREQSKILEELHSAQHSLPRLESAIQEIEHKLEEAEQEYRNKAKEKLNETEGELLRNQQSYIALRDQVNRTIVRSPVKGIVQKLNVNTIMGVVKPGQDLVEIVPMEDKLWLEVKIKPSDIAFIYPGQKAVVKFSAYDFAIYGSLEGEVVYISADTTKDEKERPWYIVHIQTNKNYLGDVKNPMKIIPGMTVDVDILTGKKTVLHYLTEPILRIKEYTFTER